MMNPGEDAVARPRWLNWLPVLAREERRNLFENFEVRDKEDGAVSPWPRFGWGRNRGGQKRETRRSTRHGTGSASRFPPVTSALTIRVAVDQIHQS
jgi:hypothetical protein